MSACESGRPALLSNSSTRTRPGVTFTPVARIASPIAVVDLSLSTVECNHSAAVADKRNAIDKATACGQQQLASLASTLDEGRTANAT